MTALGAKIVSLTFLVNENRRRTPRSFSFYFLEELPIIVEIFYTSGESYQDGATG